VILDKSGIGFGVIGATADRVEVMTETHRTKE